MDEPFPKSPPLAPKDHAEAVARFRSEIVGALTRKDLHRGELRATLRALSQERFRPPGSDITRSFSVTTLERWLYAYRSGGLDALRPLPRGDRGHGRELAAEQRQLLIDIRKEHPSASVSLILRTLVSDGRLARDAVSESTVRRLYQAHGLDRVALRDGSGQRIRLRWQAAEPGSLWHADVCHGPALLVGGQSRPLRIHALLDDASRFLLAIEARHTERESDMLQLFIKALRKHGPPDLLYLDFVPRHIIKVLCPPAICGRQPSIELKRAILSPGGHITWLRANQAIRGGYVRCARAGDAAGRCQAAADRHAVRPPSFAC
jgi:putative transposase